MFLGALVGAVAGGLMGLAGDSMNNSAASDRQEAATKAQIEWNREAMQNKHQWEIADLKKAGLNPMLSAMNGSTGTLGASAAVASPGSSSVGSSASSMSSAFAQNMLAKKSMATLDSEIEKNNADAVKARAEAQSTLDMVDVAKQNSASQIELNASNADLFRSETEKNNIWNKYGDELTKAGLNKAKIDNIYAVAVNEALISKYEAESYNARSQGQAALSNATTNRINADTARMVGISQQAANYAASEKGRAEAKKDMATFEKIVSENKVYNFEHSLSLNNKSSAFSGLNMGRQVTDQIPILGNILRFLK